MRTTIRLLLIVAAAFLPLHPALAQRHTEYRNAALNIDGAQSIRVEARAGELHIEGRAGLREVRVEAFLRAPEARLLKEIRLVAKREGDVIRIETVMPEEDERGQSSVDLKILVPDSIPLDVTDTSGHLEIEHTGALVLRDNSGEATLRGIGGPADVKDSSGNLHIDGVAGNLRVNDSSGNLEISNITGGVRIDDDSSGNIGTSEVTGDVLIEDDSSGNIDIARVTGEVRINDDSSGSIDVSHVGGSFIVGHNSNGTIRYRDVTGEISIPSN